MAEASSGLGRPSALIPSICLVARRGPLRFIEERVPGISVPAR